MQMTDAFGGFYRCPDPQHRGQPRQQQPQEAQLCSQMNTRPHFQRSLLQNQRPGDGYSLFSFEAELTAEYSAH